MLKIKYLIGKLLAIPLLPIMFLQSKRIRRSMPNLPEAGDLRSSVGQLNAQGAKAIKLLFLGESSVAGVGVESHHQSLVGAISKTVAKGLNTQVRWDVVAKSGYSVKMLSDKLLPQIKDKTPDLIIIGMGANDAFQLNSLKGWRRDINALIQNIRKTHQGIPILFSNMPPVIDFPVMSSLLRFFLGNLVILFGKELSHIVAHHNNVWFNERRITLKGFRAISDEKYEVNDFFSDGVHPSGLTYRIWGEKMGEYILSVGVQIG